MKYGYCTLLAIALLVTSCKNSETETVQAKPANEIPFWQQSSAAVPSQTNQAPGMQSTTSGMAGTNVAGLNPAHGQPNHRCDIAVGAPLNPTANGVASTQAVNVQSSPQMVTTITPTTVTAKGMNPPHGEKNHRCDIAVGAPLNSKSNTVTAPSSAEAKPEYTVEQPVPALLSTTTTETPAGMNPAHGKEGHRCDIAVGDPLPKS